MIPNETIPNESGPAADGPCANETCVRPAEPGEIYCGDCGLERSLYLRDRRGSGTDQRVETLRETARRFFGG
jgi:hypothetical protein